MRGVLGRLCLIAGFEVPQLGLEVALESGPVLPFKGPQLFHPHLERRPALFELTGDAAYSLLGFLHCLRCADRAVSVQLLGPGLRLGQLSIGLRLGGSERLVSVGPSLGEDTIGLRLGLRQMLVGSLLREGEHLHGLPVVFGSRRPAALTTDLLQLRLQLLRLSLRLLELLASLSQLLLGLLKLLLYRHELLLGLVLALGEGSLEVVEAALQPAVLLALCG